MGKPKKADAVSAAAEDIDSGLDGALVFIGALIYHDVTFLGCFHVGGTDAQTPMAEWIAPFKFDDAAFFFEVAEIQVLRVELADYFGELFGEFLDFIIALAGKGGVQRHDPLANRRHCEFIYIVIIYQNKESTGLENIAFTKVKLTYILICAC